MIPTENSSTTGEDRPFPDGHTGAPDPVFRVPRRGPDRILRAMVASVFLISVAAPVAWLDRTGVVLCLFRRLTGLPCPGCGLTHAFLYLGHGDVAGAMHQNALGLPLFALGIAWLAREMLDRRGTWPRLSPRAAGRAMTAAVIVMLVYGVYRILVPSARPF